MLRSLAYSAIVLLAIAMWLSTAQLGAIAAYEINMCKTAYLIQSGNVCGITLGTLIGLVIISAFAAGFAAMYSIGWWLLHDGSVVSLRFIIPIMCHRYLFRSGYDVI